MFMIVSAAKEDVTMQSCIEAVKRDHPIITLFLSYGLSLESEDRFGYTALLHALNRGKGELGYLNVLIDAGADLTRRTASGFTPFELAQKNLHQYHPRAPRPNFDLKTHHPVSLEEDIRAYNLLKTAIAQRRGHYTTSWIDSKNRSDDSQ